MTSSLIPTFVPSRRRAPAAPPRAAAEATGGPRGAAGGRSVFWTGTARSALRPVLLHLRRTGRLEDESAEILVPRWICLACNSSLQKLSFPTTQDSPAVRGVMAYHQYGFPQRLDRIAQRCRDRGLFLIENCVNGIVGEGRHGMGETGLAAVYSLGKMFRTVLGGALTTADRDLAAFCADYLRADEPWIGVLARTARRLTESLPGPATGRFQELAYAVCDYGRRARPADLALLEDDVAAGAVAQRRRNYARLLAEFSAMPFFEGLEADVTPYVAPVFGPEDFLARLARRLVERGFESGVYHFDAARDVFEPNFVQCVPLPVHQGLAPANLDRLVETTRDEWNSYNAL